MLFVRLPNLQTSSQVHTQTQASALQSDQFTRLLVNMPANSNNKAGANNTGAKSTPMTGDAASRIQSTQVSLSLVINFAYASN